MFRAARAPSWGAQCWKFPLGWPGLALCYSNTHKGLGSGCIPAGFDEDWNVFSPAVAESIFPHCPSASLEQDVSPGTTACHGPEQWEQHCEGQHKIPVLHWPREMDAAAFFRFHPNPWENSCRFLSAAAGTRCVRAVPALPELSTAGVPCSSSLCPRAVWLCLSWGTALTAASAAAGLWPQWDRHCPGLCLHKGKAKPSWPGGLKGAIASAGLLPFFRQNHSLQFPEFLLFVLLSVYPHPNKEDILLIFLFYILVLVHSWADLSARKDRFCK